MSGDIPNVGASYLRYYRRQHGGGLSDITVYRRDKVRQEGDGIGDILRGIARFLLPLVFRGAQTFANETFRSTDKGMSFGSAAKSALQPTLNAVMDEASNRFQKGNGKRKGKKRHNKKKRSSKVFNAERTQSGSGKITKKAHKRVYKGDSLGKRKQQTGSGKTKTKKRKQQVGKGKTKRAIKKASKKSHKTESESYNF